MLQELHQQLNMMGYRLSDYSYSSLDARERHNNSTLKTSGELVYWDVVRELNDMGHHVNIEPRSCYKPEMLIKPLVRYFQKPQMTANNGILLEAIAKVRRMFYVGKLSPGSLGACTFDPSKNSGAPFFRKKGEVFEESLAMAKAILSKKRKPDPAVVFYRGKNLEEARPVFGYPFAMVLIEQMFFERYQDELLLHRSPYAGGKRFSEIAGSLNEIRCKSDWILELDYSGFDGSLSSRLIGASFDIVRNNFNLTEEEGKAFDLMATYFVTSDILLPGGKVVWGRRHGVPSGSMFTQLIDSICNCIVLEFFRISSGHRYSRYCVLGDDSAVGGYGDMPDLGQFARVALQLGVVLNVAKSSASWSSNSHLHFLGHNWKYGKACRPTSESLTKMVCPERVDQRIWKDSMFKQSLLVERAKAYANDNLALWDDFHYLEIRLEFPHVPVRNVIIGPNTRFQFAGSVKSYHEWTEPLYKELARSRSSMIGLHI